MYDGCDDVHGVGQSIGSFTSGTARSVKGTVREEIGLANTNRVGIERVILHSVGRSDRIFPISPYKLRFRIEEVCTVLLGLLKSGWLVIQTTAAQVPYMEPSSPSRRAGPVSLLLATNLRCSCISVEEYGLRIGLGHVRHASRVFSCPPRALPFIACSCLGFSWMTSGVFCHLRKAS